MRKYLFVLLALFGCAKPGGWVKDGTTQQDFYVDRGECVSKAFVAPTPFQQNMILIGCMQSKGWQWREEP